MTNWVSRGSGVPFPSSERSRRAVLIFRFIISFAKRRTVCCSMSLFMYLLLFCLRRCCIVRPSMIKLLMSPSCRACRRRWRQLACSRALDDAWGFCKSSVGITMAALRAMGSRAVPSAYARKILASSAVNRLPALTVLGTGYGTASGIASCRL